MTQALSHLVNAISSVFSNREQARQMKYQEAMVNFLSQATDNIHLEYLEREWEKTHGRIY